MSAKRAKVLRRPSQTPGFSLAETAVSVLIVGGLLVVSLDLVGTTVKGRVNLGDRGRARLLALGLMSEITAQLYEEPDDTPVFGRESSESGDSRPDYDDVDDYDNWSSAPPETRDGTKMTELDGWQREVTVEYVDPDDLTTVEGFDTGVKRITVTVRNKSKLVAEVAAIRTNGM